MGDEIARWREGRVPYRGNEGEEVGGVGEVVIGLTDLVDHMFYLRLEIISSQWLEECSECKVLSLRDLGPRSVVGVEGEALFWDNVLTHLSLWVSSPREPAGLSSETLNKPQLIFAHISSCHPHALDLTTLGLNRHGPTAQIHWETQIFESTETTPDNKPVYPHLTLLSTHSCNGHNGSITLGELTQIVTAMRNRSRQPAFFDPEQDPDEEEDIDIETSSYMPKPDPEPPLRDEDLAFPAEKRFPVLMVSLVGEQHARILYACLDSGPQNSPLVIRMSEIYNFIDGNTAPLTLIGCALLSRPLMERTVW
ncbi:hypothetical protein BJX70DRAFT_398125 [Aspergillus crustosus]